MIRIISALWALVTHLTRLLLRLGLLKSVRLNARVISVGNLQAGGAGKTPLVAQIAQEAIERGLKVCILARGYKGSWERSGGILMPDSEADARECGDEPALLHQKIPQAFIGVGANRIASYQRIITAGVQPDLVILDDGFQHWRIHKDVEVVAVTSATPSEKIYRDTPQALNFASLIVWTKGTLCPTERPHVEVHLMLDRPQPGRERIWLVTGVGDALSVERSATEAGYSVINHVALSDHASCSLEELAEFSKAADQSKAFLATTGKDWVKWQNLGFSSAGLIILEPKIVFIKGRELWNRVLWES